VAKVIASARPLSIIPAHHRVFLFTVRTRPGTQIRRASPPISLGERPGRLQPEGMQIDRSVLLFQAVLRRLARPTPTVPVPSTAAAEGASFSNQKEERGGRDGTIRSRARG
jgi:hypothetical protein